MFLKTKRDLTVFYRNGEYTFIACDSLGGIGEKKHDSFRISPRISGKYTLRVCLNEVFSVGATPICIVSTVSNEWNPTGIEVYKGIEEELEADSIDIPAVNGSTEENFDTDMTAFGITVVSQTAKPRWRGSRNGYALYLYGIPSVGPEVLPNEYRNLKPCVIKNLMDNFNTGDIIPCGSGGIYKEIEVLCAENGLYFDKTVEHGEVSLDKSAGPSTCGIFTSDDLKIHEKIANTILLGYLYDEVKGDRK